MKHVGERYGVVTKGEMLMCEGHTIWNESVSKCKGLSDLWTCTSPVQMRMN